MIITFKFTRGISLIRLAKIQRRCARGDIMSYSLRALRDEDKIPVIDIFNYYIENGFAAFPDQKIPYPFFEKLKEMVGGYPFYVALDDFGKVIGFGLLYRYHLYPVFSRTAEVGYFISPEHTNKGVGTMLLSHLLQDARGLGVDTLLASISSFNEASLNFHSRQGFAQCGRFERIGRKNGLDFDVVWMQKFL